eukprot:12722888-Ditylum_brightwellii.AAC.1
MIEKVPGDHKIHKLQVIHICKADYAIILGVIWCKLVASSERRNILHPGQHGGQKGKDTQALTLMEELKYDISCKSRKDIVNFDNDAVSCYDRIIPGLENLIRWKKGTHYNAVFAHAKTLEESKFKLYTVLCVSEEFYQHCQAFPSYGAGQGSTNSPTIWLIISSTPFDAHESKAHGAIFVSPDLQTSGHL